MILETRAEAPFYKNGFVVGCERTHEGVIVDPGDEVDELLGAVRDRDLEIRYILLTHAHVDHITGVGRAKRALGVPICLHKADNFLYEGVVEQAASFGLKAVRQPPVDHFYSPDEVFVLGEYEISVHHTPGHCPGGVCLAAGLAGQRKVDLFVGDTLFAGSIGRTDFMGADHVTLLRSIRQVLFAFGDDARVYPGHGPATTIGHERRSNRFLI